MTIRIKNPDKQAFEEAHEGTVRKLAPECMVLLRNDGTLPLKDPRSIALYGNGARQTIKGGTGSGDVNVRHFVSVEEGLTRAGVAITTTAWLDAYDQVVDQTKRSFYTGIRAEAEKAGINPILATMGKSPLEPDYDISLEPEGQGGEADVAVYVLARNSGEGSDRRPVRGDIKLTESELRDITALNEEYDKFVLVLNVGGVVDLSELDQVKTILLLGQLGTATGDACADVLLGRSYPSGKLTTTWAPIEDYPSTGGFGDPNNTEYKEGVFVGYRYFDSAGLSPSYPFGYGLGYTSFTVEPAGFSLEGDQVTVEAVVTNTGEALGKDVVQVYLSAPQGSRGIAKPYQTLVDFAKSGELRPGESQTLRISFGLASLASYDQEESAYVVEAGSYLVRMGDSSRSTHVAGVLTVDSDFITEQLHSIGGDCGFEDSVPAGQPIGYPQEEAEIAAAPVVAVPAGAIQPARVEYQAEPQELSAVEPFSWKEVVAGKRSVDAFVASLTEEELTYLCIGSFKESGDLMEVTGNASSTVAGAAGETTHKLEDRDLPVLVMSDGPAGLRLSQKYYLDQEGKAVSLMPSMAGDITYMFTPEERETVLSGGAKSPESALTYYQYCTAIPIGTELAQAWNDDLVADCGDLVGDEMESYGVHLWLAPAMNIHRSPLCGRDFEYYSEDPLVAGRTAAAITNGVHRHPGCATTIKHFAANNQETNRYFQNNKISERALREIYLKGFEICVKLSHPRTVMTSYNLVNGEHTCNRRDLVTEALRDEWGFDGFVMTDWLVTGGMGPKGDQWPCASAAGDIKAGNDVTMPGIPSDKKDILDALADPQHPYALTKADLQLSAKRVLSMILELTEAAQG